MKLPWHRRHSLCHINCVGWTISIPDLYWRTDVNEPICRRAVWPTSKPVAYCWPAIAQSTMASMYCYRIPACHSTDTSGVMVLGQCRTRFAYRPSQWQRPHRGSDHVPAIWPKLANRYCRKLDASTYPDTIPWQRRAYASDRANLPAGRYVLTVATVSEWRTLMLRSSRVHYTEWQHHSDCMPSERAKTSPAKWKYEANIFGYVFRVYGELILAYSCTDSVA